MKENKLVRVLGLKESISMTIGTVVGVGLFTCGSAQIGLVGSWIIGFTFTIVCIVFYYAYTHNKGHQMLSIEEEIGDIEEPDVLTKEKMDREYNIWKIITIIVTIVALGIYIIPMLF